jgi:hypothetical protein
MPQKICLEATFLEILSCIYSTTMVLVLEGAITKLRNNFIYRHKGYYPPIYLYLIFLNLNFTKLIFELDFLSISNSIFAGCTGSKNRVCNRKKIKFKNQFSEIEISKNQVQIDRRYLTSK